MPKGLGGRKSLRNQASVFFDLSKNGGGHIQCSQGLFPSNARRLTGLDGIDESVELQSQWLALDDRKGLKIDFHRRGHAEAHRILTAVIERNIFVGLEQTQL